MNCWPSSVPTNPQVITSGCPSQGRSRMMAVSSIPEVAVAPGEVSLLAPKANVWADPSTGVYVAVPSEMVSVPTCTVGSTKPIELPGGG